MAEFEPITSQEQLDGILKDRLARKDAQHEKTMADMQAKYSDYDELKAKIADYEGKIAEKAKEYDGIIAEKDAIIKGYEVEKIKSSIATQYGLKPEAVEFLTGDTEEEITASAEKLSQIIPKNVAPLASSVNGAETSETAALKSMLPNLFN